MFGVPLGRVINIILSGYPESPSDLEFVRILDTRLRGNDGRAVTLCHTREGGYSESITQLGLCR
jgi:hypothetical protein